MKIAIIPARGGSKRIPKKNIKLFRGRPMLNYPVEAAVASGLFDHIYVSTDCNEIKDIALSLGCEVPFVRPPELSDDYVGTGPVVKHAIQWVKQNIGEPEYVCCLYPTTPFITPELLKNGYDLLKQQREKSFAFSVGRYAFPVKRSLTFDENNNIRMLFPECQVSRSQDLSDVFHDAGQFYWGRTNAFLNDTNTFGPDSIPVFLPRHRVMDIDDEEDWLEAEFMYDLLLKGHGKG